MRSLKSAFFFLLLSILAVENKAFSQACTTLGQTPATAFPVCGTTTFHQLSVPLCSTNSIFVPGCSDGTAAGNYENKNPFFYKFTCFVAGTLGFTITPLAANEDYDWQLWDITGRNPQDVFTDGSLVVTANWAGTYGTTGASSTGVTKLQCGSDPAAALPTFARWPNLQVGHEYLLMVSHFTAGQSGYDLAFGGGTAVITDPAQPHMQDAKVNCSGNTIKLKLNKKIRCNSMTTTGSEFSLLPASTTVTSATSNCSGFDFDEVTITLASVLPTGNYQLVVDNGTDGTTLLDICQASVPQQEKVPFVYTLPQPILADSIGQIRCATDSIKLYYSRNIICNSIAPNDFLITGPVPVTISSATVSCTAPSSVITLKFASPIYTGGNFQLSFRPGLDGNTGVDECGLELQRQVFSFTTADTVNAGINYLSDLGCRTDTLHFAHDGAHAVNFWKWTFNNTLTVNTQTHNLVWPATSTNTVQLIVSNGVCGDTTNTTIVLDNEVIAGFDMPPVICPEDALVVKDTSVGLIDNWHWTFGIAGTSNIENPLPVHFPTTNIETYYVIKQVVVNNALNCRDSVQKVLRVFDNCFIAVPTAFTPNGDGLNDFLYPNNAIKAENLKFSVYNRWGQLVFRSRNWMDKWDGKIGGITQATGVYVWMLEYTHRDSRQKIFQKGTVTLIR